MKDEMVIKALKTCGKAVRFVLLTLLRSWANSTSEEKYEPTRAERMYGERLYSTGKYRIPDHKRN